MYSKIKILLLGVGLTLLIGCHSNASFQQHSQPLNSSKLKPYDLAMQVAEIAVKSGNFETAEAALKQAHEDVPSAARPVEMMAELYISNQKYQQAASLIEANLPQFKNQPYVVSNLQRQLGLAYWHLNHPHLAVSAFESAYQSTLKPEQILNDLGVFMDHTGDYMTAQRCYRRGLERAPSNHILMNNYLLSLLCSGEFAHSKELINNRVLISSSNASVLKNRDLAVKLLAEGEREHQPNQVMVQAFRRQFGFEKPRLSVSPADYAVIQKICS